MREGTADLTGCFLCDPEREWTWKESENFRAVLGLGPIGQGYTLIATREHLPSMFDLDWDLAHELDVFSRSVQQAISEIWGPSVVCEHGRVAPCVAAATRRHEPHCLHAHRLVFPGQRWLDLRRVAPKMTVAEFSSFPEAHDALRWRGQYVYVQGADGQCQIGLVDGPIPRQFLRAAVAAQAGCRELADWRHSPRREQVDEAREMLARVVG